MPVILSESPFEHFMAFSDWVYANTDATHRIALDRLAGLVTTWLVEQRGMSKETVMALVSSDYAGNAKHKQGNSSTGEQKAPVVAKATPQRQSRHLAA